MLSREISDHFLARYSLIWSDDSIVPHNPNQPNDFPHEVVKHEYIIKTPPQTQGSDEDQIRKLDCSVNPVKYFHKYFVGRLNF